MFRGQELSKQTIGIALGAVGGFAACWLALGISGCGKGEDAIAVVNGEAITAEQYYRHLQFKPDVRVLTDSGPAALQVDGSFGFQALQDLIAQKVTLQLARDKKLFPTDAEINKELEFKKKLNPNFLPALTARGYTFDLIRESITLDLVKERMLTEGINVTAKDVDDYVKQNPKEFIEPERAEIYWILIQDKPTQDRVNQELNAGQSFSQVALRHSAAPDAKETGARLLDKGTRGNPAIAALPQNLQQALKPLRDGQKTGWIPFVDGQAMFMLKKRVPERPVAMDDAKRELLRRLLAQRKGSEARDLNRQVLTKLRDSKVDIKNTTYQNPWKEAYKEFMKENKLETGIGASQ